VANKRRHIRRAHPTLAAAAAAHGCSSTLQ